MSAKDTAHTTITTRDLLARLEDPHEADAGRLGNPILQQALYGLVSTVHNDHIGVTLEGYATRFGERDTQGQRLRRGALACIESEYFSDVQPKVYYAHGSEPVIGWRPIGWCIDHGVDDTGLWVSVFVPRDPDPKVFPGPLRAYHQVIFDAVVERRLDGLSIGGNWLLDGSDITLVHLAELSLCVNPAVTSARATIKSPDAAHIAQSVTLADRAIQALG